MPASAVVAIVDLNGTERASFVPFEGLQLTRRVNGYADLGFTLDPLEMAVSELAPASRAVKLWRRDRNGQRTLRFHGKIGVPFERSSSAVTVNAFDPFWWASSRRIYGVLAGGTVSFSKPRSWLATDGDFPPTDAGLIGWQLLEDQRLSRGTGGDLRVVEGAITPSVVRERSYEPGKLLGDAISELANVDDGFFFFFDPIDDEPGKLASFNVSHPYAGADLPGVRFAYGDGTDGNLEDYSEAAVLPVNGVLAIGAGDGESRPIARRDDELSRAEFDLLEDELALSSARKIATLAQHATAALRPSIGQTYTVTPAASEDDEQGPFVPRLFDDFDVGDVVRLSIEHGAVRVYDLPVRVNEATIAFSDATSSEQLVGVVLEVV